MILLIMDSVRTTIKLLYDLATFVWLMLRPHGALVAENLFLRKQLAMYQERKQKPPLAYSVGVLPSLTFSIYLAMLLSRQLRRHTLHL